MGSDCLFSGSLSNVGVRIQREQNPRPEGTEVSEPEGDSFECLDCVVATLGKPIGQAKISIKVEDLPEAVRICVLDRGCGIAPGDLPNIFQMFYTSRARRPDASPGMGLGLAICEAIVQAHGGSIAASNREDGPGAQFCFTLPKDAPQARQEGSL